MLSGSSLIAMRRRLKRSSIAMGRWYGMCAARCCLIRMMSHCPFFLSISLIVKCPKEADDENCQPLAESPSTEELLRRAGVAENDESQWSCPTRSLANPSPNSALSNARKKKIDEIMKSLQDEIQKLDDGKTIGPMVARLLEVSMKVLLGGGFGANHPATLVNQCAERTAPGNSPE